MKVYNYSSFNRYSNGSKRTARGQKFNNKRTHLGLFNNPFKYNLSSINSFYFQIAGILMITLAIIISFQTLIDISSPTTSAGGGSNDSVRVMTNFQADVKRSSEPKIKEIIVEKPADDSPEDEVDTDMVEVQEVLTKTEALDVYIVQANDNLYTIADLFGIPADSFIEVNSMQPPYSLNVGDQLRVPKS